MGGRQTKWGQEKDVLQDIIRKLQFIQEFEDKPLELSKCNNLEPTKLQLNGLNRDASLEKFMPQGDLLGGSRSTKMTKEGDNLKNHDKMT